MNNISVKSFLTSCLVIFILMVATFILTFIIPSGEIVNGVWVEATNNLTFGKWLLSPILVLTIDGGSTIILVIAFLLIIGGVFEVLNRVGFIKYLLDTISFKFQNKRYLLLAIVTILFMLLGSFIGSFEEVVPFVPIMVLLCISLGFDAYVGIAISLIAVGCGFSAGIMNPFTVGVAQSVASSVTTDGSTVAMFSGIWLRIVAFILIYALLLTYIIIYAKHHERKIDTLDLNYEKDPNMQKSLNAFAIIMLIGIIIICLSSVIPALQDYTMVVVLLMFLVSGIISSIFAKVSFKDFAKGFLAGIVAVLPATIMILMASSIRYTLVESNTLGTIMSYCINLASKVPSFVVILLIYILVLIFNFFIPSGSAKALLLIPIIVPLAMEFGISPNLAILAFAFGDGFSNVFYPTNPVLLISLNLSELDYKDYVKFSWKFQALNFVLTCGILLFGFAISYH